VFFDVANEGGTGGGFVGSRGSLIDFLKIFHGKLRVDGKNSGLGLDGRINNGASLEVVLEMETIFREHLGNEVGEHLFTDVASELGGLEIVLEIFHGATDFTKGASLFF